MKNLALLAALALASLPTASTQAVPPGSLQLPTGREFYFAENDLVYSRYLLFSRDGSYRQINHANRRSRETDRGTWRQDAHGTLQLHSTRNALRFRALLKGPLLLIPDDAATVEALPALAANIRHFLDQTSDSVFARNTANELRTPFAGIMVARDAETFSRDDLASLSTQIDHFVESERTHTYFFTVLKPNGFPFLLVQRDAVFQLPDVLRIVRDYPTAPGEPPPFYFAQVDAKVFARRVGSWQELPLLGDAD